MIKRKPIGDAAESLRTGKYPVSPFHWEIEFPEVFGREKWRGSMRSSGIRRLRGRTRLSTEIAVDFPTG